MLIPWNVEYAVAFQNLCTLTFKYGSFQPFLLERLWAQLVARYRANIASILQFIVQTILQTVHAPPSSSFPPYQSALLTVCGRARGVCRVVCAIVLLCSATSNSCRRVGRLPCSWAEWTPWRPSIC
jgi:hypothetical protein